MVNEVLSEVFGIWYLIGASLVFFMQAGFAMVEAGFTRAKNAGNIIMKNTMDFCLGAVAFLFIGYSLLCGDGNGFIGWGQNPLFNLPEQTGLYLRSTLSSAQPLQRLYRAQWLKERNSCLTAFTQS